MIIEITESIAENLTQTEKSIVKYINQNETKLSRMSIVDIAFETFSSPSTVSRAIRKCGINGFNELRYKLMRPNTDRAIVSINEIMNKSLIEAEVLLERISLQNLLEIVRRIELEKDSRVYVLARGLTSYVAKEFSLKLQLLDYDVMETDDPNIMKSITKHLSPTALVIIFSLKGKTEELVESARNAYSLGADVITCCCAEDSPLLPYSAKSLIGFKHKHVSIREYEVTSRVALSIMARMIVDYLVQQNENKTAYDH